MFVRTECDEAYWKLFDVTARSLQFVLRIYPPSKVLLEWQVVLGEDHFADWFHETFLIPPWEFWFVTASGVAGVTSHQQPIESHRKCIKQICAHELRAVTSVVLNHTLPRILVSDAMSFESEPTLWDVASFNTDTLDKALLLTRPVNHKVLAGGCVVFNVGAEIESQMLCMHCVRVDERINLGDAVSKITQLNALEVCRRVPQLRHRGDE
ncbi:hypothetical protein H310_02713 [Aphanomyces invadans]|uniref:Uncharacterized protein n=1 Tax=Aphanomyces invadans TaxID=157072 RepID=A0A024UKU4_9STRA|nr:hypothetical protein H310_02713 [Aphanomyces invadans]ETW06457.1 hypothetical protein H310_02713 [Aphanomyces invadans]|eukprot:XP_008864532.1 hypothetical protein H310_02713 [Aphanomyces invadans]